MNELKLLEFGFAGLVAVFAFWVIKLIFEFFKGKPNGDIEKKIMDRLTAAATEQRENAIKEAMSTLTAVFEKHLLNDTGLQLGLVQIAKAVENSNMILSLLTERMRVHDDGAISRHQETRAASEKCRRECKEEHARLEEERKRQANNI